MRWETSSTAARNAGSRPKRVAVHVAVLARGRPRTVRVHERVPARRFADGAVLERLGPGDDVRRDAGRDEAEPRADREPRSPPAPAPDGRHRPHPGRVCTRPRGSASRTHLGGPCPGSGPGHGPEGGLRLRRDAAGGADALAAAERVRGRIASPQLRHHTPDSRPARKRKKLQAVTVIPSLSLGGCSALRSVAFQGRTWHRSGPDRYATCRFGDGAETGR